MKMEHPSRRIVAQPLPASRPAATPAPDKAPAVTAERTERKEIVATA